MSAVLRVPPPEQSLAFIVTTPGQSCPREARKLIRSHVMRGKNRKKPPTKPLSWINGGNRPTCQDTTPSQITAKPHLYARVGHDFSFTLLGDELGQGATAGALMQVVRHLRNAENDLGSLFLPNHIVPEDIWVEPIFTDPACLHLTIYFAKTYSNMMLQDHQENQRHESLDHFGKAVGILQRRLTSMSDDALSDSTITVVYGLARGALGLGDLETASKHVSGLQRIVQLRGGIQSFQGNRIQIKVLRYADLPPDSDTPLT